MGLYKQVPPPSGRMGILWTCALIEDCAILEYGSMGHMVYSEKWLRNAGFYDSKLYSAHISEKEIALGIDKKLRESIRHLVEDKGEKVICVIPSSVHEMIGMDIEVMVEELALEFKSSKIISFKKGGFKELASEGIEEALYQIVKTIPQAQSGKGSTFNIIGSGADYARYQSDVMELERIINGAFGMQMHCALTSHSSIENIETMTKAKINIVMRKEGLKAAKYLEKEFGMPYVYMSLYGSNACVKLLEKMEEELSILYNYEFIQNELKEVSQYEERLRRLVPFFPKQSRINIGGPIDIVDGISSYASSELHLPIGELWVATKEKGFNQVSDESMLKAKLDGIIMGSYNLLRHLDKSYDMCIVNDYAHYELNPYIAPFIGFRGAINLCCLWAKEIYS